MSNTGPLIKPEPLRDPDLPTHYTMPDFEYSEALRDSYTEGYENGYTDGAAKMKHTLLTALLRHGRLLAFEVDTFDMLLKIPEVKP